MLDTLSPHCLGSIVCCLDTLDLVCLLLTCRRLYTLKSMLWQRALPLVHRLDTVKCAVVRTTWIEGIRYEKPRKNERPYVEASNMLNPNLFDSSISHQLLVRTLDVASLKFFTKFDRDPLIPATVQRLSVGRANSQPQATPPATASTSSSFFKSLPSSLTSLRLIACPLAIAAGTLPVTLTTLKLRNYAHPLSFLASLPALTWLDITQYQLTLAVGDIPTTVHTLVMLGYMPQLDLSTVGIIPNSVTRLQLDCQSLTQRQQLPIGAIPSSVTRLDLLRLQAIPPNSIPSSVTTLRLNADLSQHKCSATLQPNSLPPSITSLDLGFRQVFQTNLFPAALKSLVINILVHAENTSIPAGFFPARLESLSMSWGSDRPCQIEPGAIPESVTWMDYNGVATLRANSFPSSLRSLTLHKAPSDISYLTHMDHLCLGSLLVANRYPIGTLPASLTSMDMRYDLFSEEIGNNGTPDAKVYMRLRSRQDQYHIPSSVTKLYLDIALLPAHFLPSTIRHLELYTRDSFNSEVLPANLETFILHYTTPINRACPIVLRDLPPTIHSLALFSNPHKLNDAKNTRYLSLDTSRKFPSIRTVVLGCETGRLPIALLRCFAVGTDIEHRYQVGDNRIVVFIRIMSPTTALLLSPQFRGGIIDLGVGAAPVLNLPL
ncbi:hypothetical protein SAMD00019534_112570 [Acytostelium subglobosum LB1]|uniref:hypothetical protein n=1 Tax=Acytostelium subglobosum LB1 TaxID=1410327 RepID=UPI000644D5E2|nr:hypothetical protein SAMD00019534_112570 [Acytostelium subglobosum LB1]GAM28081.1 hypothetical protein SAMD00019534_112570 [Acytostelium subglobosum LB1]|eukprot:XP_012749040.1 hypothetical protein SAMD00019534_112570 [Acytostelium subglobosum LB1]